MPSTLPYWCEMWKSLKTPIYFFQISRASNFSCRRCGRFVKFSFHRIQYRWRELFFSWALFIVVVLLLAAVYLFYSRLIKKLDRKNKKKTKKTGHGVCWIVFTVQRIRWTDTRFKLLLCFVLVFTHNFRTK